MALPKEAIESLPSHDGEKPDLYLVPPASTPTDDVSPTTEQVAAYVGGAVDTFVKDGDPKVLAKAALAIVGHIWERKKRIVTVARHVIPPVEQVANGLEHGKILGEVLFDASKNDQKK